MAACEHTFNIVNGSFRWMENVHVIYAFKKVESDILINGNYFTVGTVFQHQWWPVYDQFT